MEGPTPSYKFKTTVRVLYSKLTDCANSLRAARVEGIPAELLVNMGAGIIESTGEDKMISTFIDTSVPYWDLFKARNQACLIEHVSAVFPIVPSGLINSILTAKDARGVDIISKQMHDYIWKCLEHLVMFAIDHIVLHPQMYPKVDLAHHRLVWKR